jgi:hypothetical protein
LEKSVIKSICRLFPFFRRPLKSLQTLEFLSASSKGWRDRAIAGPLPATGMNRDKNVNNLALFTPCQMGLNPYTAINRKVMSVMPELVASAFSNPKV